jgi:hypothetical protein
MGRRHAAGGFTALGWEGVFHPVDQEFLDRSQEGFARLGFNQARAFKAFERRMDLGWAQPKIASQLSNWRTPAAVAHELGEHDDILG